jgi:hypothetical protein
MNKITSYKNNIESFLKLNKYNYVLDDLNILICILFLTDFYKQCKKSNLSYHGYYVMIGLLELYNELEDCIINEKQYDKKLSHSLIIKICKNINYLNERINYKNESKKKISKKLAELILFINSNLENINFNNNTYLNITNNLKYFFITLLTLSEFMASGDIIHSNDKISEYYACLFYVGICVKKKDIICELFNNYLENKEKLISYLLNKNVYDENIILILEKLDKYLNF